MSDKAIKALIKDRGGILLDIGCGANKQGPDWVGMDVQELPGVDIMWDFNIHPWPIPDESCVRAICTHVVEHIPPVMISDTRGTWFPFIEFMDEVWRIMKPDGQFAITIPHGYSRGMLQDPTHTNFSNEDTMRYFDPLEKKWGGAMFDFYRPKPWKIMIDPPYFDINGNIEWLLQKRREDKSYYGE